MQLGLSSKDRKKKKKETDRYYFLVRLGAYSKLKSRHPLMKVCQLTYFLSFITFYVFIFHILDGR